MIVYDFINETTGEVEEVWLKSSGALGDYETANPHMKRQITIPNHGDPLRLGTWTNKMPTQFREGILGKAKTAHPLGTIQT